MSAEAKDTTGTNVTNDELRKKVETPENKTPRTSIILQIYEDVKKSATFRHLSYIIMIVLIAMIAALSSGVLFATYWEQNYTKPQLEQEKKTIISQIKNDLSPKKVKNNSPTTPMVAANVNNNSLAAIEIAEKGINDVIEKADAFYNNQFSKLLTIFGIIITIFGIGVPLLLTIAQSLSLKEDRDKIDKATQEAEKIKETVNNLKTSILETIKQNKEFNDDLNNNLKPMVKSLQKSVTNNQRKETELSNKIKEQKNEITKIFEELESKFYEGMAVTHLSSANYSNSQTATISHLLLALLCAIDSKKQQLIKEYNGYVYKELNLEESMEELNNSDNKLHIRENISANKKYFSDENIDKYPELKNTLKKLEEMFNDGKPFEDYIQTDTETAGPKE